MTIILVMITSRSIANAKAHFTECIDRAEAGDPVMITRHGKPVAAIVRANDLIVLSRLHDDDPKSGLAGILDSWNDDEGLANTLDAIVKRRALPRRVPTLK